MTSSFTNLLGTLVILCPEEDRKYGVDILNSAQRSIAEKVSLISKMLSNQSYIDAEIIELIHDCAVAITNAQTMCEDYVKEGFCIAKAWCLVGLLQSLLLFPRGSVDPACSASVMDAFFCTSVSNFLERDFEIVLLVHMMCFKFHFNIFLIIFAIFGKFYVITAKLILACS